jgi:ATP-dependent DNA ligase
VRQPPSGPEWLIEITHDGFRVIARKERKRVRLYSRPGNDLTHRFPLIVEALGSLRAGSSSEGFALSASSLTVNL